MTVAEFFSRNWQDVAGWLLLLDVVVTIATLCWVMHLKRETMSAIAWSLTVILLPILGAFLFFLIKGLAWLIVPAVLAWSATQ